jgi:hypothetical protein
MHYQGDKNMSHITYDNIIDSLLKEFPEFNSYDKENIDLPHVIIGNFAEMLVNKIENNPNDDVLNKAFEFVNKIFSSNNDNKLLDLLRIELFENLAQSRSAIMFSRKKLNGTARDSFEKAMTDFGVVEMR